MSTPIRVIIESPFAGSTPEEREINAKYLDACLADSFARGEAPFASHAIGPRALDDTKPYQREQGIQAGFSWRTVGQVTAVYTDLGMSGGMSAGVHDAKSIGQPVDYRQLPNWQSPAIAPATATVVERLTASKEALEKELAGLREDHQRLIEGYQKNLAIVNDLCAFVHRLGNNLNIDRGGKTREELQGAILKEVGTEGVTYVRRTHLRRLAERLNVAWEDRDEASITRDASEKVGTVHAWNDFAWDAGTNSVDVKDGRPCIRQENPHKPNTTQHKWFVRGQQDHARRLELRGLGEQVLAEKQRADSLAAELTRMKELCDANASKVSLMQRQLNELDDKLANMIGVLRRGMPGHRDETTLLHAIAARLNGERLLRGAHRRLLQAANGWCEAVAIDHVKDTAQKLRMVTYRTNHETGMLLSEDPSQPNDELSALLARATKAEKLSDERGSQLDAIHSLLRPFVPGLADKKPQEVAEALVPILQNMEWLRGSHKRLWKAAKHYIRCRDEFHGNRHSEADVIKQSSERMLSAAGKLRTALDRAADIGSLVSDDQKDGCRFDFAAFFDEKKKFSEATFGPNQTPAGVIEHIRRELKEIEEDPFDVGEHVDLVFLAMDLAWRFGQASGAHFAGAMENKLATLRKRTWPDWRTMSPDAPREHVRAPQVGTGPVVGKGKPKDFITTDEVKVEKILRPVLHRTAALPGYESLAEVFDMMLEQAQSGKGRERHSDGGGLPWEKQKINIIPQTQGHVGGLVYQICKKATECEKMTDPAAALREALGVGVYAAALAYQAAQRQALATPAASRIKDALALMARAAEAPPTPRGEHVPFAERFAVPVMPYDAAFIRHEPGQDVTHKPSGKRCTVQSYTVQGSRRRGWMARYRLMEEGYIKAPLRRQYFDDVTEDDIEEIK